MTNFPKHNIDPRKKDKKWHLDFIKAAYNAYEMGVGEKMFYKKAMKYEEIRSYALAKQSVNKYKKTMGIDEETNTTYANVDFRVLGIIKRKRQTALGRLQKSSYNISATTIDTQARNEVDEYYAQVKAKLAMKKAIEEQMPQLANHPALQLDTKDPQDLDELEMQAEFGFKHQMAIEAEDAVNLGFAWNDINRLRDTVFEKLFDEGVSVYKTGLGKDGKPKMRICDNRNIICNYVNYADFRDLLYIGEVIEMPFYTFEQESEGAFTPEELEKIYNSASSSYGNSMNYPPYGQRGYDRMKVWVVDLQWYSIDNTYFESRIDRRGNEIVVPIPFDKAQYNTRKYSVRKDTMVYKGKWILGTDFIYDWGKKENIIRHPKEFGEARLDYHVECINFHNMECKGVMEDLIPIADQIQNAWLKWQNIQNSLLPYLIEIDLDALEDVAIGKGGAVLTTKEVLDMAFQSGILVSRRRDISEKNINYNAVNFIETNYGELIREAWNNLISVIGLVNEVIGLNELTDGNTPNPKILTNPALMANEGTNNALYNITKAEKNLLLKAANAMVSLLQLAVKRGKVEGYLPALGMDTPKFISISPNLALHDFGIILEDKPSDEMKQMLQAEIMKARGDDTLDITDAILVESEPNIKRAWKMLAYKISKRRDQKQKEAMQLQQMNAQVQMQSNQQAEQMKQQTLQLEYQLKAELLKMEKEYDLAIKKLEMNIKDGISEREQTTKERVKNKELGLPDEEKFTPQFNQDVTDILT